MSGLPLVLQAVIQVYRDGWSSFRTLWPLAAVACLATIASSVIESALGLGDITYEAQLYCSNFF